MIDAFLAAPLAQGIGLAGTACGMSWPLFHGRLGMLLGQLATNLCFALHYALLGAETGCAMNLLAAAQVAAGVVLTWNGMPSLFAALGFGFVSLARYQTEVRPFRLAMAVAFPCWFTHNLLVASAPGMLSDVVGMTLNFAMLARLRQPAAATPP